MFFASSNRKSDRENVASLLLDFCSYCNQCLAAKAGPCDFARRQNGFVSHFLVEAGRQFVATYRIPVTRLVDRLGLIEPHCSHAAVAPGFTYRR